MKKVTQMAIIKDLKRQREELQQRLHHQAQTMDRVSKERDDMRERIKVVAAENEDLRKDKAWLKSLVQQLSVPMQERGQMR